MADYSFADGRRQIVRFYLPGDLMGWDEDLAGELQVSAITRVTTYPARPLQRLADDVSALADALDALRRSARDRLDRHVLRLGRASARERLADFLLELQDREGRAGLATGEALVLPLSQEIVADHLGLSVVHVNRMLQQLRREGLIHYQGGWMRILDRPGLASAAHLPRGGSKVSSRTPGDGTPQDRSPWPALGTWRRGERSPFATGAHSGAHQGRISEVTTLSDTAAE
jgi:CRP-like cAMP-binding protein